MKKNLTIGILAVITISSLVFAYDRSQEADHQRDLAEFHKLEAQEQRLIAEQNRMLAENERDRAMMNEAMARLEAIRANELLSAQKNK